MDILQAIGDTPLVQLRRVAVSTGADVVAAGRVAARLGPGARVATLMADTGLKYLGTGVYRQA